MIKKLKSNSYYDIVYNISLKKYEQYDRYNRDNVKNNDYSSKRLWHPEERMNRKSHLVGQRYGVKCVFFEAQSCHQSSLLSARLNEQILWYRDTKLRPAAPHPNVIPLPPEYWYKNMKRSKFSQVFQNLS